MIGDLLVTLVIVADLAFIVYCPIFKPWFGFRRAARPHREMVRVIVPNARFFVGRIPSPESGWYAAGDEPAYRRTFAAWWHFVGWSCLSLGVHVDWRGPHVEVHLPFGFVHVGWRLTFRASAYRPGQYFTFGIQERFD